MYGFDKKEVSVLKKLNSPRKIQDFLDRLKINFEPGGDTCLSPRMVLKERKAHCIEGAMLAAVALRLNGHRPLVVDLASSFHDYDHVIAVYRQNGYWGAISKVNHCGLRYRDPVYKTIRELVMSYFHEYTDRKGKKTLRSYSMPVDLSRFDKKGWMTSGKDVWFIPEYLLNVPHKQILSRSQISTLRKWDKFEMKVGSLEEWKSRASSGI